MSSSNKRSCCSNSTFTHSHDFYLVFRCIGKSHLIFRNDICTHRQRLFTHTLFIFLSDNRGIMSLFYFIITTEYLFGLFLFCLSDQGRNDFSLDTFSRIRPNSLRLSGSSIHCRHFDFFFSVKKEIDRKQNQKPGNQTC